ncbi:MAG TPA: carboxypeptidase regulatory-like domain-containing protein, partial [Gemmatimonadales bacterium]|nr:carboxypeptidase regulatory-like domain-containing protein [Gemmatimonadales bacterium]
MTALLTLRPTGSLAAQVNGAITGRVVDGATGNPISGAQVRILGTGQGAATDTGGRFRVREVRPGRWTVTVTRIGYRQGRRDSVAVIGGEVARLE